jgi:DNA-binding NarL/FixJ family response regulator
VIGVAIVEDHPLYRQVLIQTIETASGIELIVAVGSIGEMEEYGYQGIDVVLLDLHLPDGVGAEAVARVRAKGPSVLVVSASDDRQSVVDAIGAGASGYVPKSSIADEIANATLVVASGAMYVSPVLAAYLLQEVRSQSSEYDLLSAREQEILSLLSEGETDAEIAEQLFISVRTVHSHLDRIRDKTGRRRRADLTRLVMEQRDQLHQ